MMYTVCFWIGVSILAVTIAGMVAIIATRFFKYKLLSVKNILLAGLFSSVFVLMIPPVDSEKIGWVFRLIRALHNTFQVFTIDVDASSILQDIKKAEGACAAYPVIVGFLMIICPIVTISFILFFFKSFSAFIKLHTIARFYDRYIFSELNEYSIALAEDIVGVNKNDKNNGKDSETKKKTGNRRRAQIVFTDVFSRDEEESYDLIERAKKIGAICYKADIVSINFKLWNIPRKKTTFFIIGENEPKNLDQSLKLIDKYRDYGKKNKIKSGKEDENKNDLYVFSTSIDRDMLFTKTEWGNLIVHRVNRARAIIIREIDQNGINLFKKATPTSDGKKKISAVIVGLGQHGTEMLKAISWYCQMYGYEIEIDAFDVDPCAEDRVAFQAPGLLDERYNGKSHPGYSDYTIRIHSGYDVASKSFADEISKIRSATYVFISLGSDNKNVSTAVNMRMLFERVDAHPDITAVVYNSDEKKALKDIANHANQPYDIRFIGDTEDAYSKEVIMGNELEKEALKSHLRWGSKEDFYKYEYNYNSSIAAAVHKKARLNCNIIGADKSDEELTDEERKNIETLEHQRWVVYMLAEGYLYSGSPDKGSRNDLAKIHNDLIPFDDLSEEEKRKDSAIGTQIK